MGVGPHPSMISKSSVHGKFPRIAKILKSKTEAQME